MRRKGGRVWLKVCFSIFLCLAIAEVGGRVAWLLRHGEFFSAGEAWKGQNAFAAEAGATLVMFCTDDGLFHDRVVDIPWPENWDQVAAYSFRLGENCRYSHPADEHYRLPSRWRGAGAMVWDWTQARADFRYSFSLDAHIFPTPRIRKMLTGLPFHNPNTLEDVGSRDPSLWERKWMAGPLSSKYVSLPVNRVNETHANRAGTAFQSDPEELARRYLAGHRIDLDKTVTSVPQGPHKEYVLRFSKQPF